MKPDGLRRRKRDALAQALHDSALELFGQRGFDATTVRDISDRCGVSVRTFFRYYPTKEAVLFAGTNERVDKLVAFLQARPSDEPPLISLKLAFLEVGFEGVSSTILARNKIIFSTPRLKGRLTERQVEWEEALTVGIGASRRATDEERLARYLAVAAATAAVRMAIRVWVEGDGVGDLTAMVTRAFESLESGLGRPAVADRERIVGGVRMVPSRPDPAMALAR